MNKEEYLKEVKVLLDFDDTVNDEKLKVIIKNTIQQLKNRLVTEVTDIPSVLDYIVTEVTIKRFNRIGSEGMKSDSEEGKSISFYDPDDDFKPYLRDIKNWNDKTQPDNNSLASKGRVMFY